jgi:hypothetical protein
LSDLMNLCLLRSSQFFSFLMSGLFCLSFLLHEFGNFLLFSSSKELIGSSPLLSFISFDFIFGFSLLLDFVVSDLLDCINLCLLFSLLSLYNSLLSCDLCCLFLSNFIFLLLDLFSFCCSLFLSNSVLLILDFLGFSLLSHLFGCINLVLHESLLLVLSLFGGEIFGISGLGLGYLHLNLVFGDLLWGHAWISGLRLGLHLLFHVEILHFGNQVFGVSGVVSLLVKARWLHPHLRGRVSIIRFIRRISD